MIGPSEPYQIDIENDDLFVQASFCKDTITTYNEDTDEEDEVIKLHMHIADHNYGANLYIQKESIIKFRDALNLALEKWPDEIT